MASHRYGSAVTESSEATAAAAFWDRLAEDYARKPVDDPAAFERKIEITRARMSPQDVVLDLGCGTGSLALRLASSAAHVHGLDVSGEMIRIARDKARAQDAGNVTFHAGAFDDRLATFEPESLDGICAYSLLHLVDDLPATLARIHRLLRPGGFFISSTVCLGGSWVPYRPLLWLMYRLGKAPRVKALSRRRLEEEVRRAGFVEIAQPDVGAKPTIAFLVATKPRDAS